MECANKLVQLMLFQNDVNFFEKRIKTNGEEQILKFRAKKITGNVM